MAIKWLAVLSREDFPLAFGMLTDNIYVDNVVGGADSKEAREDLFLRLSFLCCSRHTRLLS